eukprot:4737709-Prorocentrum_lima.AAC.1
MLWVKSPGIPQANWHASLRITMAHADGYATVSWQGCKGQQSDFSCSYVVPVSYTHLRAHETRRHL